MSRHITVIAAAILLLFPVSGIAGEIVINAVGDVMLAGSGTATFRKLGYDYPFAATADELRKGDITFANLETPVARQGDEFKGKKYRFRTDPRSVAALRNARFSVVSLANNHTMDFGRNALVETMDHLDRYGILHAGAGTDLTDARRPAVLQVKGARVAFLAYSLTLPTDFYATAKRAGTAPGNPASFRKDIARAKAAADYVVVSFHWGTEGAVFPSPYQVMAGHAAIDAGANVVLGHHPHVLQGIERYGKGVIFYSLGNFAFGSLSRTADRSMIARITLEREGVTDVELVPLNVRNSEVRYQPRPLKGKKAAAVIARLNRLSRDMGTVVAGSGNRFLAVRQDPKMVAQRGRDEHVPAVRGD